ncbi:Hsp70 family protein [Micromonospora sp. NBC_01813]|uniref:Hsp70 family protein n=1 Tax=Micromonospora sp. NBC_01813 TaxID=2975988 RepID=UPI002DDBD267|nr:Hsp70 family protein [Micromonospora sp. NBC_01813]WSA06570.1 Hsp70 family protein [Micromonospora sp. NBC_01813]
MYALGIDLGTTFTAAAVWRDGRVETVSLGGRSAAIPSVVLLRQDETFLTGEAAHRRGLSEPHRVAREFKRRLGDTTPILLGGVPQSAEALMSRLLRSVVEEVARREGGFPGSICVSHPANWGPYKMDLLRQAVRMANLDLPVSYTSEPEGAAVNYAEQLRIEPGAVVAVYDLGGGTFDAAVLRKTPTGFEILGQPEGIERLGGIDFDAAVFNHVRAALGGKLEELDEDDPAAIAAVARLRDECIQAKEALSSDTDTAIPVLLPNISTEIRLTRSELEAMVRPVLHGSIEALHRAVRSAGCSPEQLHSVLLVGGSSRMPIVSQLVGSELGRPVAVDAHPKYSVSLGAAWLAALGLPGQAGPGGLPSAPATPGMPAPAVVPTTGTYRVPPTGSGSASVPVHPVGAGAEGTPTAVGGAARRANVGATYSSRAEAVGAAGSVPTDVTATGPAGGSSAKRGRGPLVVAAAVLVVLLAGAGVTYALTSGGQDDTGGGQPVGAGNGNPTEGTGADPDQQPQDDGGEENVPEVPADEQCTDEIKSNWTWVCLTSARVANGELTVEYEAEFGGNQPSVRGGWHLHIFGSDGTSPSGDIMGDHIPHDQQGFWYIEDQEPSVIAISEPAFINSIADYPKVCARISNSAHELAQHDNGGYTTGNCVKIRYQ